MDDQLMLDGEGDDVRIVSSREHPARVCAKPRAAPQERLFAAPQTPVGSLALDLTLGNGALTTGG